MQPPPVFILSDFGTVDTYVAQMKASILSIAGTETPVIDLTHQVSPGDVLQAAFHLRAALPHLPEGSVVLAVVDPGVGSSRLGLLGQWQGRYIVAPDNGLISLLEGDLSCWKLPELQKEPASTFHGRDVFAPCAARIAADPGWTAFLDPLDEPVMLQINQPEIKTGGVEFLVLHADRFGNCILNLKTEEAEEVEFLSLSSDSGEIPLKKVKFYSQSSSPDEVLILSGSLGYMEIAVNGGSASDLLNLSEGNTVQLTIRRN